MKRLTNPELNVIRFASEDVIATSALLGLSRSFFIPSSQYSGSSFSSDYVEFYGTFSSYNDGIYGISNISGAKAADNDEMDQLKSGGAVVVHGVTLPVNPTMKTMANQYYDAYSYGDGQYYTNGISYYDTYWQ